MIYSGESFSRKYTFIDGDGNLVDPVRHPDLTLRIRIINRDTGAVVREVTPFTPAGSSYTLQVTVADNTISGTSEKRLILAEWTFNNGTEGDTDRYRYKIKK